jgi:hypothetical protein
VICIAGRRVLSRGECQYAEQAAQLEERPHY